MSDETIRAYERELQRQGQEVLILRGGGLARPAEKGACFVCKAPASEQDVREMDLPNGRWLRLCRSCIEAVVARVVHPQALAKISTGDGALYIRIVPPCRCDR